jgi:predicted transglutaminase-like cysteine proteinase
MRTKLLALAAIALGLAVAQPAQAGFPGLPKALKNQVQHLMFREPVLAPMAFIRFCMAYPSECEAKASTSTADRITLTNERWAELVAVNHKVNDGIAPQPNTGGVMAEKWLLHPAAGDCNDYAVTKRHELIARGWSPQHVLLAEVVVASGEHHLVVVVRTSDGDLVLDNLASGIRLWSQVRYRWVRVQTPADPNMWSKVTSA